MGMHSSCMHICLAARYIFGVSLIFSIITVVMALFLTNTPFLDCYTDALERACVFAPATFLIILCS